MIMPGKIWAYLIIILALIGLLKWAHYEIDLSGYNRHKAETLSAVNNAVKKAREEEQAKQGEVDEVAQKQFNKLNDINNKLNADLDRLRKRAARRQSAKNSKPICEGATGRSLSSEDAGFLTREAARADKIRTALEGCYNYADSVAKKSPN